jgi:Methyltransferase domain
MTRSTAAWTAYWQTGRGASCLQGADLELDFGTVWHGLVDELPNGARLLDLATGNGVVARLCAARSRMRGVELLIDAVDAAAIEPSKVADPANLTAAIRFGGGVRIEDLPFPDATFDAIVSQFGFEYADEDRAVAEVARVAAPQARLKFVIHAQDGVVSRDIARRLDRLRAVLDERGPLTLVRTLVRALEAGSGEALARESAHLQAAVALTRELARDPPADDAALFYAVEFLRCWSLRERYRRVDLRRSIEDGWANADGVATREADLLRVAHSRDDIAALGAKFEQRGFAAFQAQPLNDERRGAQIAWLVSARRQPCEAVDSSPA